MEIPVISFSNIKSEIRIWLCSGISCGVQSEEKGRLWEEAGSSNTREYTLPICVRIFSRYPAA